MEIPHKGHTHIFGVGEVEGNQTEGKCMQTLTYKKLAKTTREKQIKPLQTQGQNRRVMEEETARRGSIEHPKVENVDIGLRFRR